MSAELHLVNRCEHGMTERHVYDPKPPWRIVDCDSGSVVVLDPEQVLTLPNGIQYLVKHILAALAQERT